MTATDTARAEGREGPAALASSIAALHVPNRAEDLHQALASQLREILPAWHFAVLIYDDPSGTGTVELVEGAECPHQQGKTAHATDWGLPEEQRLKFCYSDRELGELQIGSPIPEAERCALEAVLTHYAIALVNLTLTAEAQNSTELYCASLQALEEGVVLFQEEDPDTITARFLGLCTNMMQATAGALYVLEEVGDLDSDLRLVQTLGIHQDLLKTIEAESANAWPQDFLQKPNCTVRRVDDPTMGGMDPRVIPDVLQTMVVGVLQYHGVVAGLCVLFNVAPGQESAELKMSSLHRLGELGAALLHRLSLERISLRSRDLETQLKIASTIQSRLLPTSAPDCPGLQFAWRSQTAQHIGGDYLDLMSGSGNEILAVIADVSGHGVNSALLMSSFRSLYRAEASLAQPHDLLAKLNKEVHHEVGSTGMFITAAAFRFAADARSMTYSGGGHNPAFLYRAGRGIIEELKSESPPLGFIENATFEISQTGLSAGDVLVLYTDGIVEAMDAAEEMFGEQRFKACIERHASSSASELLEEIFTELQRFTGRDTQEDDVSLSIVKAV